MDHDAVRIALRTASASIMDRISAPRPISEPVRDLRAQGLLLAH
jgi:hypothetical protein